MSDAPLEEKNAEYVREYVETVKRAIVAYANTDGGTVYVGIDDFGNPSGVSDPADVVAKIRTLARDAVWPSVLPFIDVSVEQSGSKKIVVARVARGTDRPYCLAEKGLTPDGVLVRENNANVPASPKQIRAMLRDASEGRYEEERSVLQGLTFEYASKVFERARIPFGHEQFAELGLLDAAGAYTNLARLLSDQCPSTIRLAFFEGTQENQIHDRLELNGSIFQQFDDAYAYLDRCNRAYTKLHGANRGDFRDYPPEIVREILLNAVVHRDYSRSFQTIIRCYHDRLETVSFGGIPENLSFEEILLGVSVPRNPKLAEVFYQLQLVESCGVGVQKIRQAYANYTLKPKFEASKNFFKVALFHAYSQQLERKVARESVRVSQYAPVKISVARSEETASESALKRRPATIAARDVLTVASRELASAPATTVRQQDLSTRERRVLQMFNSRESITCRDVEVALNLTQASAAAILRRLVNSGRIVLCGAGSNIWYRRP